jgi:hypothetical protein
MENFADEQGSRSISGIFALLSTYSLRRLPPATRPQRTFCLLVRDSSLNAVTQKLSNTLYQILDHQICHGHRSADLSQLATWQSRVDCEVGYTTIIGRPCAAQVGKVGGYM